MNKMIHGFSETDWNDYLEGAADESLRDRIEAHLIGCWDCWEFHNRMARTASALRSSGERLRVSLALPDQALHAGLRGVFEKLNATEQAAADSSIKAIKEKLDALAAVLTPMCGAQTAVNALRAAAVDSPARSLDRINAGNWTAFLKRLRSIAAVMCGETGARLVWESGQF
jgi:hypothetical protein